MMMIDLEVYVGCRFIVNINRELRLCNCESPAGYERVKIRLYYY